jgi:CO dehydrogenase maturation factor
MCRAHATVRGVLGGLVAAGSAVVIVDLEAGLEHLSRGTARHVDTLLVVGEPYFKSLETARRSVELARDLGIPRVHMVANKLRTPGEEATVREFAARHGLGLAGTVPYDEAVADADQRGLAAIEHRPDSPGVAAIRRLADHLWPGAA